MPAASPASAGLGLVTRSLLRQGAFSHGCMSDACQHPEADDVWDRGVWGSGGLEAIQAEHAQSCLRDAALRLPSEQTCYEALLMMFIF